MDTVGCVFVLVALIIGFLVFRAWQRSELAKRIEAARALYQQALGELRRHPTDPERKTRALELGRAYSALTREDKAVTVFDEMALSNDISAATAGATVATAPSAPPVTPAAPAPSTRQRLQQLSDLKDSGAITNEEYQARRKAILDAI
jgi:hypothetical protein